MSKLPPLPGDPDLDELLRRSGPMNRARAAAVMERHGIDGLVLGEPLNVFHALGYWPQIARTRVGQPPTTFAIVPRDPAAPAGIVTTRFIHYYTWADGARTTDVPAWLFDDAGDAGDETPGAGIEPCPDLGLEPLSAVERHRREISSAVPAERRRFRDAGAALVRALRELGLWQGRLAADHPVVAAVCVRHERPGQQLEADPVLREIRIVKSPLEIRLMRRASAANLAAVEAVIRSVRAGASYTELRRVYEVEAARFGNRAVFLTVDRISNELADEKVRDGQTFFVDGVSHFRHYHGDFARTLFVGEPERAAREAAMAMRHAWDAIRGQLRPGLRYSDIVRIGREALRSGGFDTAVGFGPHSVGLAHTDEPCDDVGGFYRKSDLVLQPDMILSVDCPVLDTGVGGSAHLEDLMLITATGAEPLHETGGEVIQL